MKAKYVIFDGMDGCGKGTQMSLLQKKLGGSAVFTREPGGPPLAEDIRGIIRDNPLAGDSTALFHFLMFWGAREETVHKLVMPALQSGKHVFSDRGDSSTFAFQLCGEEYNELDLFIKLRNRMFLTANRQQPDLYIFFDLPAEVSRMRVMQDASRAKNHFDDRDLEYYQRVREGFREFAMSAPTEFVDATKTPEEIHRDVLMILAAEMIIPELVFVID